MLYARYSKSIYRILTAAFTVVMLAGVWGCDKGGDKEVSAKEDKTLVVPVKVRPVLRKTFVTYIEATGQLRAKDDVLVKSEAAGLLVEVPLEEGARVKKGDILARLDEESYKYALEEARGALKFARADLRKMKQIVRPRELEVRKASLERAQASYQKAKKDWERIQRLYRQEVVSKEVYDVNRAQMEVAEAGYRVAKENYELAVEGARKEDIQMALALVKQAEARVGMAEKRLRDCRITSPLDGEVARMLVESGETIAAGTPIANVVNTTRLEVEVGVVQEDIVHLRKGEAASIFVNVYPRRRFSGTVTYAGIKAEGGGGSFPVIVEMSNDDGALRPGMIATIRIARQSLAGALVVSRDAVLERGSEYYVFTVTDGVARRKPVVLGAMQDQEVVVVEGLAEGEAVVEEGQESLQDDARVSIQGGEM